MECGKRHSAFLVYDESSGFSKEATFNLSMNQAKGRLRFQ